MAPGPPWCGCAGAIARICCRSSGSSSQRGTEPFRTPGLLWPSPAPGDHKNATPSCGPRHRDEGRESGVRFGLSHSVQIEVCLDPMQTALQPFGVGAVDPGKSIERRHARGGRTGSLNSRRSDVRLAPRPFRIGRPGTAQRPNVANRFLPEAMITSRARCITRSLHLSPPDHHRRERYGDAWAHAHPVRCAARCPPCAMDQ